MPTPKEIVDTLLNYPAFDGGPTVSVVLRESHEVYNAMFYGGPSMEDDTRSASSTLGDVMDTVRRIEEQTKP
jgi:hypothetical protein